VVTVAGHRVDTWEQFFVTVGTRANHQVEIGLLREGLDLTKNVTPVADDKGRFEIGDIGVLPNVHPHLTEVFKGDPADQAGLRPGDVIVAADGEPLTFTAEFIRTIRSSPGKAIVLSILRGGMPMNISVTPKTDGKTGLIGVRPADDTVTIKPSLPGAFKMSAEKNLQMTAMIGQTIWGLLTRQLSPKQLMGPIAIAQLSGESAQLGWIALITLMASISLNLGLLNLMPVPVLDGGHIFIMALEGLARRDFSQAVKEKMLMAGFAVILMLMVTVIYNDLTRISWIEHLMPWR
jgi:regulator of sigma E protease